MDIIKLNATELADLVHDNREKIGSTSYDIYINDVGKFDIRHNSLKSNGWYFFTSLYSWWNEDDQWEDFDAENYGDWLKSDGIGSLWDIKNNINQDLPDDEKIELEWED